MVNDPLSQPSEARLGGEECELLLAVYGLLYSTTLTSTGEGLYVYYCW